MVATTFTMRALLTHDRSVTAPRVRGTSLWDIALGGLWAIALLACCYTLTVVAALPVLRLAVTAPAARWLIDLALLGAVGLHHRYAMPGHNRPRGGWRALPRVAYAADMAGAGLLLAVLVGGWQPLQTLVWHVGAPAGRVALWLGWGFGWVLAAWATVRGRGFPVAAPALEQLRVALRLPPRRPAVALAIGIAVAGFSAPDMSADHLLVAASVAAWLGLGQARRT